MSNTTPQLRDEVRIGRLISVTGARRTRAAPARFQAFQRKAPPVQPAASRAGEFRLLLGLGAGGAYLVVLALVGALLRNGPALEVPVPEPTIALATVPPAAQPEMVERQQPEAPVPEVLPEPVPEPASTKPVSAPPTSSLAAPALDTVPEKTQPPQPAAVPEAPKNCQTCGKFGTRIVFLPNPPDAFQKAKDENKQVFFLHLSGNFEDKEFT